MFPFRYNNGLQIVQSPGYVALRMEMIHESRIIPINGLPVSPAIKEYLGVSAGIGKETRWWWKPRTSSLVRPPPTPE